MKVSEHAKLRYLERVLPDKVVCVSSISYVETIIKGILEPKIKLIEKDGAYKIKNEVYAVIKNQTAVTVISKKWKDEFIELNQMLKLQALEEKDNQYYKNTRKNSQNKERSYRGSKPKGSQKGMWSFKGSRKKDS
jgi:hypothetical protein